MMYIYVAYLANHVGASVARPPPLEVDGQPLLVSQASRIPREIERRRGCSAAM